MPFYKLLGMSGVWAAVILIISVITREISLKDRKRGAFIGAVLFFIATFVGFLEIQKSLVGANNLETTYLQTALMMISVTWASIGGNFFC